MMTFATLSAARRSLREFTPAYRKAHHIVRFWSETHGTFRYARVFGKS